ncbi:MAG: S41 family peptidase [Bacteroidota bacterium]|nr:S41 family peptidase [Bacteroidota bacterium]
MRKKKLQIWLPVILSICMVAGMFIGYRIKGNMPDRGVFFMEKQKPVQEVLDLINRKYVDKENVDSLGDIAIQSLLSTLDPHSIYLPAKELKEVNEDLEGVFFGIGVEFNIMDDTTNVLSVLPKGPADKAGIQVGDKFIKVGDSLIAGTHITAETLKKLLRGSGGSNAVITLLRDGKQINATLTRGPIPLYSLDAAYMITDTVGYIRLNKFAETTYREFMQAMDKLQKKGMKSLILDLRDNGGGILTEATNIADEFLSDNKLITYTEGAHSPKKEYRCDKEGVFETGKLIVLANEGTASASEVLIGALQDWDRATIIGRRSFGKGLVQEQYQLNDGSGLRLTVARYYTPLGRSIQKSYSNGNEAYNNDLMNRFRSGEMNSADSIKHTNEKKFTTKSGKVLYDGGGITPDVFVPYDTTAYNKELMRALMSGTISQFVYLNYLHNEKEFKSFTSPGDFDQKYVADAVTLNDLKMYAQKDSIRFNLNNPSEKSLLSKQIKVLTARQIWNTEGYYEVNNTYDKTVKKALQLMTP